MGTLALSVALLGCGGKELPEASNSTAPAQRIVSLHAVRAAQNPAARTVLSLWRYVQLGVWPLVIDRYHPRVVEEVGQSAMIGALMIQQANTRPVKPKIVDIQRTPLGTLVTTTGKRRGAPTLRYSFLLRSPKGRIFVVHDTLLGESLGWYIQNQTQDAIDPDAKVPGSRAVEAGRQATQAYARLFAGGAAADRGSLSTPTNQRGAAP